LTGAAAPATHDATRKGAIMRSSLGLRFIIVGILTLLMFIPLLLASEVVRERKRLASDTLHSISAEWGGAQTVAGPILIVPVEAEVTLQRHETVTDPANGEVRRDNDGNEVTRLITETVIRRHPGVHINPGRYDVSVDSSTQMRHRGIFNVPVYQAALKMEFDFPVEGAEDLLEENETLLWDEARLEMRLSSNASLRGVARLMGSAGEHQIEPLANGSAGIQARIGAPNGSYTLELGLNGARHFRIAPMGRQTAVTMRSDWPDPSFGGAFLPDGSEISPDGFTATWTIPHLARTLPQLSRELHLDHAASRLSFGVELIEQNDFYQKAWRASNYGILFIALTFLTVLLIDRTNARPTHPVQFILIGLAQSTFVLLMVAFAEQIGFGAAYLVAAGATIALITLFAWGALKLGLRSLVLLAMLILLYAVLYLILVSIDFALLAGSTLAFIAIAATMWFTRNEDWYGPTREGWLPRRKAAASDKAAATEATNTQGSGS
jgi:inner membrane protein